jgi:tetratricopeptide (TPR) repeat protein
LLAAGGSAELRERAGLVRDDLEMVLRLEESRFAGPALGAEDGFDPAAVEAALARAFREYGIDLEALEPAEAAERINARPVRHELAAAVDHWIKLRASMPQAAARVNDELRTRLVAVAQAVDPDEWRNHVRAALAREGVEELRTLSASPRVGELPVYTLSLLGNALDAVGAGREAVHVLRQAQQKYPDDAEINFQLGWALDHRQDAGAKPEPDEVIRFYTVARALRPRNVAIQRFLGEALARQGRLDEAAAVFRKAVELNPDQGRHHDDGRQGKVVDAAGAVESAKRGSTP